MNIFNVDQASALIPLEWGYASIPIILFTGLWSIVWKGLALWHSGRRGQTKWFVVLLVVNTLGILEIMYLFGVITLKFGELFSKKV